MKRISLAIVAIVVLGALSAAPAGAASHGKALKLTSSRGAAMLVSPAAAFDVNFDELSAPCGFAATTKFKKDHGVKFMGSGAVLNECSNFQVTGYSPPNFLAFNCQVGLSTGAKAKLPETMSLKYDAASVSFLVGGDVGKSLHVHVERSDGAFADGDFPLDSPMQQITGSGGIDLVTISSTDPSKTGRVCIAVVDDVTVTR
jgi:hypothetical protein